MLGRPLNPGKAGKSLALRCLTASPAVVFRAEFQPPTDCANREVQLLYSGTLSSWQGVHLAVEALALLRRDLPARLMIIGSGRTDQIDSLKEFAWRHHVSDSVEMIGAVSQQELAALHHRADVILVPLAPNDRNLVQGCCPMKLLEAMASGTPVVASNLPVVREIASDQIEAHLVRPGCAKSIKDAVLQIRNDPVQAHQLSTNARTRIENYFTWNIAQQRLRDAYKRIS